MHYCKTEGCQCNYWFNSILFLSWKFEKHLLMSKTYWSCFQWHDIHGFVSSRLLLQLTTEAHAAETSMAFGFSLKSCRHLLEAAKELGVQVVGVTFHIPSSCQDMQQAYTHALSDARCVFDMGVRTVWKISLIINWLVSRNLVDLSQLVFPLFPQCFISCTFFFIKGSNWLFFLFRWIWALTWTSWTLVVDLLAQNFSSNR